MPFGRQDRDSVGGDLEYHCRVLIACEGLLVKARKDAPPRFLAGVSPANARMSRHQVSSQTVSKMG